MNQSTKICNHLYELAKEKNGQNVWINVNDVPIFVVQNHDTADYILNKNHQNYLKNMKWFRQTLGASRFSENGEAWQIRKELTQHYFSKFDREQTFVLSCHYAKHTLARLIENSDCGQKSISDDVLREMATCVLLDVFLGVKLADTNINIQNLATLMEYGSEYSFVPAGQTNALFKEKLALLPSLFRQVLADFKLFRSDKAPSSPLLEGILAADQDPSNDIVLEHELLTFFAAGAETTAATVGWACYLLAQHPQMQEELRQESMAFWQGEEPHDWAHLSELPGLTALISEALRLYPSTPIIARLAVEDDTIDGQAIPAGQNVLISFIGIQHDEKLHQNPWVMDIEQAKQKPHTKKGSGINTAFSSGPRVCGGKHFALVELAGFLSIFLSLARFTLTSSEPVKFHWKSQMLHEGGQPVSVTWLDK